MVNREVTINQLLRPIKSITRNNIVKERIPLFASIQLAAKDNLDLKS
jgi:hypothetical protein